MFAGGILVEGQLELQTDPIKWVNQDSQVIHDLHTLDRETGSSSELGMFVQSKDVFDDKTVGFMDNFTTEELAEASRHAADGRRHRHDCERHHQRRARRLARRPDG